MKKIVYLIFGQILLLPAIAHGQQGSSTLTLPNPLGSTGVTDVPGLINAIANFIAFQIASPIITIMVLWGAFKMLTAAGNESKFQEGRKAITYAVIGAAVVLLASGVTALIRSFLNQAVQ